MDKATRLRLVIGAFENVYVLHFTNAPRNYDAHGTLQVTNADERYVLIPERSVEWQVNRYHSGLFWVQRSDDLCERDLSCTIVDALPTIYDR